MNGEGTNVKKKGVNFNVGSPPNSPLSTGSSPADYHTVLEMSPSTADTVESLLVPVSAQAAHNDISMNRSLSRFHVSKEQVAPSTIRNTMSDIALQQKRGRTNTDVEKLLIEPTQTPVQTANGTNGDVTLAVPRSPRVRPTRHNFSAFSMDNGICTFLFSASTR